MNDANQATAYVHGVPMPLHTIIQPTSTDQKPAIKSVIEPLPIVPQTSQYITPIDPVYIDHLSRHVGHDIVVGTSAGEFSGKLSGVAVDHIQLNIENGKALHIRIAEIIYFEGYPLSYP
ncbi:DUF2642 domain-containing protein [Virgibacillus sp. 179-BFC.A HS]|uniref:DUF2642 domain-containing protein n=1 Tax=Tigheibacillus jepli TaxID=3035914 RepID=A0ABU5CFE2_9BACI|nr:DUF2642 domain-containing protein [Virgibacillus sp. 179-BFC.A HS]MDY0405028.1 DUF2642 domain-containing protein [Virgibacillus sp. 179-BFC.A HS]